jgi:hypothetical protein
LSLPLPNKQFPPLSVSALRWVRKILNKHDLLIVFALSTLVGLILYVIPQSREFGVNFLTEMAGVWIAVFLVNRIIEKRERQKRVYIDQRILQETLSIIASYFSIWKHLVWKYFPDEKIHHQRDLHALYPSLLRAARLSDRFEVVSTHHPESWKLFFHNRTIKECFENYHESLQGDIRALIDNFKMHLEPQLLGYLLEINENKYFSEVHSVLQIDEADVLSEFGRDMDNLSSYISIDTGHFSKITELCHYCQKLNIRILEFADFNPEHYNMKKYFANPMREYSDAAGS